MHTSLHRRAAAVAVVLVTSMGGLAATAPSASAAGTADLRMDLFQDPESVAGGGQVTYYAYGGNLGPDDATAGMRFDFDAPVVLVNVVAGPCTQATPTSITCTPWLVGANDPEDPRVVTVSVPSDRTALHVTASFVDSDATDPNPANNSAGVTTTIVPPPSADLGVSLDAAAGSGLSSAIDYTLAVANNGPLAGTSATVTVHLPTQTTSVPNLPAGCTYASATDKVTCTYGAIAVSGTVSRTFRAQLGLLTLGSLPATATRTASAPLDINASNDSSGITCSAVTGAIILCP